MERIGAYSQKKPLSGYQTNVSSLIIEALVLFGMGIAAVMLHQAFRFPLHLPGKQGLLWIAILVACKCSSRLGLSGSLTGMGAASASVCFAGHDPFSWAIYLTAGFLSDIIVVVIPKSSIGIVITAMAFGLIHVTKPVMRGGIDLFTNISYPSLWGGILYPVVTHFVFGFAGTIIGIAVAKAIVKARSKSKVYHKP